MSITFTIHHDDPGMDGDQNKIQCGYAHVGSEDLGDAGEPQMVKLPSSGMDMVGKYVHTMIAWFHGIGGDQKQLCRFRVGKGVTRKDGELWIAFSMGAISAVHYPGVRAN